jgi:sulfur carrier protein ThiS
MKVRAKLFGILASLFPNYDCDEGIEVQIPDGGSVEDLLALLGISNEEGPLVTVNGLIEKKGKKLKDADAVNIFHSVVGG